MKHLLLAAAGAALAFSEAGLAAGKKELTDAVADTDFHHEFPALAEKHDTRVVVDRRHQTIYRNPEGETGAEAMLDIFTRDGFDVRYTEKPLDRSLNGADMLVIHGLPNDKIELPSGESFWRSPLTPTEVEAVVRFVDAGGGLFLTLSHFPNGSGAKPLLEAFAVHFVDGYIFHDSAPSFHDPDDRCSHFFGMSPEAGLVNLDHPALKGGLPVARVDYLCGAALYRKAEDAVLRFPPGSGNYLNDEFVETSDDYAGVIGFDYGRGRVVVAADQGMFRNFIFTFDETERVYVTITSPDNDNANLFVNLMRWLSPKLRR